MAFRGMPEGVQMNNISQPHRFIDRVSCATGLLQHARTAYWENLRVDALTKRALQIAPVIIAVEGGRDYGGVPTLRRRQ